MTSHRLLAEIKVDHDNVRDLLDRFTEAHKHKDVEHCSAIVNTIIHEAAVHSDAEEMSVYKLMEKFGMVTTAERDRDDHLHVKQAMSELDEHSISANGLDAYASLVYNACALFLEHALDEEKDQLPRLCSQLTADEEAKAVDDFLHARKLAPTRPHPAAPQTGGVAQKTVGAMGKAVDKAVEAGRKFVDVKHRHSDEVASAA
ncbi:uncharacterized protein SRS1_12493 [Sporisorium reilianum f. sp. reilianum]|uniref:Hemerythrin-like domain-containing protein n=1 Tax=Sporisorium reilianum f. sp. reilianum TaxID=72559 RepID=A0A2N8U9Y1_9BASI|nr:uncharacterized protein SRS1_12493 [Sporisorium reilianum f. sp. reilianum]